MGRINYQALSTRYQGLDEDNGVNCVICGLRGDKDFHYPVGTQLYEDNSRNFKFTTCKSCFSALTNYVYTHGYAFNVYQLIFKAKNRVRKVERTDAAKKLGTKRYLKRWNLSNLTKYLDGAGNVVAITDDQSSVGMNEVLWTLYKQHREELIEMEGQELRTRCEELFPDQRFVNVIISCYNS